MILRKQLLITKNAGTDLSDNCIYRCAMQCTSVIYTDEGVFEEYLFLPANPNMVLMDTEIIAKSPVRLTVSGMGDALATYFEARACQASEATTCAGGNVTMQRCHSQNCALIH